jgi:hypothetical protein
MKAASELPLFDAAFSRIEEQREELCESQPSLSMYLYLALEGLG